MDTIYYTLKTRRVKVSGGADLVTFVPVAQPKGQARQPHAGEILDLDLCRRRMETKNAWKQLSRAVCEAPQVEQPEEDEAVEAVEPRQRRQQVPQWMEIGATAALALAGVSATVAFLSVL